MDPARGEECLVSHCILSYCFFERRLNLLKVSHALQIVVEFVVRRSPGHCLHECDATCTSIIETGYSSAWVCFAIASFFHASIS